MKRLAGIIAGIGACALMVAQGAVYAQETKQVPKASEAKAPAAAAGQAKGAKADAKKPAQKKIADMTASELAERISDALAADPEIIDFVPGLKAEKDAQGKEYYTFQGKRLDTLSRSELQPILNRVLNESARLRAERINRQLEMIQRSQAAAAAAQRASRVMVPALPPQPPQPMRQPPRQPVVPPPQPRKY